MLPANSVLLDAGTRPGVETWLGRAPASGGALLFTAPREVLRATAYGHVPAVLDALDRKSAEGFWCAGYLAYEAGYGLDPDGFPDPPEPGGALAWFGVYDEPTRLSDDELSSLLRSDGCSVDIVEPQLEQSSYAGRVAAICRHILDGDVYQINLTAPIEFSLEGEPLCLYGDLRKKQRVGYGAVLRSEDRWILSLSPELFFRRDGQRVTARPMKGTVGRGPTTDADRERAVWLASDEKNRAENLMIVDLVRNDLSRIARPGSVEVTELFGVQRYETLWQMTSTVEAQARPGTGVAEMLRALFPCGSVTGAPKRRAMQLIRELEDAPRGVYCGALGMVKPGGDCVFNVPIRTVEIDGSHGRMGVGSGIVWDSDPEAEYAECILKARFLTDPPLPDFRLLETMRAEGGTIPLLDLHLARLADAADYFGFPLDVPAIRARLQDPGHRPQRIRLLVDDRGEVAIESTVLEADPLVLSKVAVFPEPTRLEDPFLRHKTTRRDFYDRALTWARERGADEALLVSTDGEVVEGTFTNVWIRRGGLLQTPPRSSGGVPGVFREHLLRSRDDTREQVLRLSDLEEADEILLSNAVRGLHSVRLVLPVPA